MPASWKPLGYYIYIASYYERQNWFLGVDSTLEEALLNLHKRRMTGEYNGTFLCCRVIGTGYLLKFKSM